MFQRPCQPPRRAGRALAVSSALVSVVLAGCASVAPERRYVGEPVAAPPRLGVAGSDETLEVAVEHWIVPNGPGSWLKDARWDEVVVTFDSAATERISIDTVRIVDPRGLFIDPGVDPVNLETRSEQLAAEYSDIGVSVAIFAAPSVVAGAAIAGGAVGTAVAAAALAPAAVIAAPAYYFWRKHAKAEDRDQIEAAFRRRLLQYPAIGAGGRVTGSYFFPIIPNPDRLVVDYRLGGERRTLEVPLDELAGLHVTPASP